MDRHLRVYECRDEWSHFNSQACVNKHDAEYSNRTNLVNSKKFKYKQEAGRMLLQT